MSQTDRQNHKPNILILVVDCLRTDRCPENPDESRLPFWSRLLRRGTYFTQMVSTASVTPVCFASILSGQYSFAHGIRTITGPAINPAVPTLATVLQENGYQTYGYLTGPLDPVFGLDRGFDHYEHRPRKDWIYSEWGNELFKKLPDVFSQKPWFTLLHFFELHYPRQIHKRWAPRRSMRRYDYAWEELNEQLDQLMELVPDDTLVILTGDHGERMARPSDRTLHGFLHRKLRKKLKLPMKPNAGRDHGFHVYDDLVRVPFLICGPGIAQGKVIREQIRQIDMMPTVLDLVGLQPPQRTHGRSIKPLLNGGVLEPSPALLESGNDDIARNWIGLRTSQWKLVKHVSDDSFDENAPYLYDLKADPKEKKNVRRDHPEITAKMIQDIEAILKDNPMGEGETGRELTSEEQSDLNAKLKALGYL